MSTTAFTWRGWLSLAPVGALIGLGIWFVLQEQRLARQEARESIQNAATQLLQEVESYPALFCDAAAIPSWNEQDVFRHFPEVLYLPTDPSGSSLLPEQPDETALPVPVALPWEALEESAMHLWIRAHQNEDDAGLEAARTFLDTEPSEPFASLMRYRQIKILTTQSNVDAALQVLNAVRQDLNDDLVTESGIPMHITLEFCELNLIEKWAQSQAPWQPRLQSLLDRQRDHSTPWTPRILERCMALEQQLTGDSEKTRNITAQLATRAKAARLHASAPTSFWRLDLSTQQDAPRWKVFEGTSYLVRRVGEDASVRAWIAIPLSWMQQHSRDLLNSWAEGSEHATSFQFSLLVSGQSLNPPAASSPAHLPATSAKESPVEMLLPSETNPWLSIQGVVLDHERFFARSRQRTRSMMLLIGLASITGFAGWFTQYRALRRQMELGRMKNNFVASVSHELRAPIASIRLLSENLRNQKPRTDMSQSEYFEWIGLECRRLSALVENILQFSRLELGKREYQFEPVDIQRLFDETVQLMRPIATHAEVTLHHKRLDENTEDTTPLPDGHWDGQAIHQALVNLVDNAIKHTPSHGTVNVFVEWMQATHHVAFKIEDQGPGIDAGDRERIFRPFERLGPELTRKTKGVGIGLSLVWHTATHHGGRVSVEDRPEGGSRFVLSLPIQPDPR